MTFWQVLCRKKKLCWWSLTTGVLRKFGDNCNKVGDITFSYSHNLQTISTVHIVVKSKMCPRVILFGFASWLCHRLTVILNRFHNLSVPPFPQLYVGITIAPYFIRLLWELNRLKHGMHLQQYLALSDQYMLTIIIISICILSIGL